MMDNKKISLASFLALSVLIAGCQVALALDATGENVEEAVRKAQVIKKDFPVHAVISGREATILTRRHPKATDDDLRIDAVLITKSVLDSFNTIGTVQVLFRDEDSSSGKSVEVTAGDIKTYANGTIDPKKFLATIAVTKVGGDDEANKSKLSAEEKKFSVSSGLYEEQRLLLMDRINTLRRKGTGVAPFEAMFAQIETQVKNGQAAVLKDSIEKLGEKLAAQEDLVRQANRTGAGRGISVISSSKTSSKNSDNTSTTSFAPIAKDPLQEDNQLLFVKISTEMAQHQGDVDFVNYFRPKLAFVANEKQRGASPEKIKPLLTSILDEMEHQPEYHPPFPGGRGRGFNQKGVHPGQNQGWPGGRPPN
ncbi:MAG: hypothetical protein Q8T09_20530 [Candidatus Melainabacteria bacterium]|nr:hypothetical protein [Candidatus Melainabacteria bacterium]